MRTWPLLSLTSKQGNSRENSELWPSGDAPPLWFWGDGLVPAASYWGLVGIVGDEGKLLDVFLWEIHAIEVAVRYVFEHMSLVIGARTK